MNKLLSIIIPCYNAFSAMQPLLSFFEKHPRSDIEVILVDDCSTDGSYEQVLASLRSSSTDYRIVRTEKNEGPGVARNKGIELAQGQYVTFLDADDFFADTFYDKIMPLLKDFPDMVVFDYQLDYPSGKSVKYCSFFCEMEAGRIETQKAIVYIRGTTCCKIYKRECILESGIRFLPQKRNEDIPFTKSLTAHCHTIDYLKEPLYHYVQLDTSLMHQNKLLDPQNAQRGFAFVFSHIGEAFPEEAEAVFAQEYLSSTALTNLQKLPLMKWRRYVKNAEQMYPNYLRNRYVKTYVTWRRIILLLINFRCYFMLKAFVCAKSILKKK